MELRPLTAADLPDALRLSTQAGWNQTLAHWQRFLMLYPQGAIAGVVEGKVVATGTLALYTPYSLEAAWIGMILVDEAMRGQGLGTKVFTAMLDRAADLGVKTLGLDASDMGQPLYKKYGFVDQQKIDRWVCSKVETGVLDARADAAVGAVRMEDWHSIHALDRDATGVDRAALLTHLASEPGATCLVFRESEQVKGFGLLQDGRFGRALGPIVAEDVAVAARLTETLIKHALSLDSGMDSPKALVIDCVRPSAMAPGLDWLGFSVARELTRMARPATKNVLLASERVYAGAGFDLG